jgi:hypothetical protein
MDRKNWGLVSLPTGYGNNLNDMSDVNDTRVKDIVKDTSVDKCPLIYKMLFVYVFYLRLLGLFLSLFTRGAECLELCIR